MHGISLCTDAIVYINAIFNIELREENLSEKLQFHATYFSFSNYIVIYL